MNVFRISFNGGVLEDYQWVTVRHSQGPPLPGFATSAPRVRHSQGSPFPGSTTPRVRHSQGLYTSPRVRHSQGSPLPGSATPRSLIIFCISPTSVSANDYYFNQF